MERGSGLNGPPSELISTAGKKISATPPPATQMIEDCLCGPVPKSEQSINISRFQLGRLYPCWAQFHAKLTLQSV